MPPFLTYATALDYLLGLGERFSLIGRSCLSYTGEPEENQAYPVLLVEGDAQGNELLRNGVEVTGLDTFTVAVQVLQQAPDTRPATQQAVLAETNRWADSLTEQLRQERSGQLAGVNKLCLPGTAGGALATGWRVELQLRLGKEIDRTTNRDLFAPETV